MNKIYAVIIIYNSEISESRSCLNISGIVDHDINVVIVDNSTVINNNKKLAIEKDWYYISMNGNAGLSKAYNKVLDNITGDGVVIWFDDDTDVTQEYFDVLEKALDDHPDCDIFAPMIQGQDGRFWSPNESRFLKNKQFLFWNVLCSNHSAFRRYFQVRNRLAFKMKYYGKIAFLKEYMRLSLGDLKILIFENDKRAKLKASRKGYKDYKLLL